MLKGPGHRGPHVSAVPSPLRSESRCVPPLRSLSPVRGYIKQCFFIFPIGSSCCRTKCIGFVASSPTATRVSLSCCDPRCRDLDPIHGDCCCPPAAAASPPPAGQPDGGILYAVYFSDGRPDRFNFLYLRRELRQKIVNVCIPSSYLSIIM